MSKHFKNEDNTTNFINRIIKQTEPIFDRDSSFPTKVELHVLEIRHAPGHSWKANEATIQNISNVPDFFERDSSIYIFFCNNSFLKVMFQYYAILPISQGT